MEVWSVARRPRWSWSCGRCVLVFVVVFLLISQISIMYTVHFDEFNTAVCSYSFAISQHILKKNLILNNKSINRLFEKKMLLAKELCGKLIQELKKY